MGFSACNGFAFCSDHCDTVCGDLQMAAAIWVGAELGICKSVRLRGRFPVSHLLLADGSLYRRFSSGEISGEGVFCQYCGFCKTGIFLLLGRCKVFGAWLLDRFRGHCTQCLDLCGWHIGLFGITRVSIGKSSCRV